MKIVARILPAAAALFCAPIASAVEGPSFDCAIASTQIETLICGSKELAELDRNLAQAYAAALDVATRWDQQPETVDQNDPDAPLVMPPADAVIGLKNAQRVWLDGRNSCAEDADLSVCVASAYRDRTTILELAYDLVGPGGYPIERQFESFSGVPDVVMEVVRDNPDCALEHVYPGASAYDLDQGYTLWEVYCWGGAYNFGSALVLVANVDHDTATTVFLDGPPEKPDFGRSSLTSPNVHLDTGDITSYNKYRGPGDCGFFARYRWDGRATIRLMEFQEKPDCDGVFVDPTEYPTIYRAR